MAPRLVSEFQNAWAEGQPDLALELQDRLMPLHTALFLETSPAPIKYAVSRLGKCTDEVRLPMVGITDGTRKKIDNAMVAAGLLN